MPRLKVAPEAIADGDGIWLSIAIDSESAAERLLARIDAARTRLAEFPELGRARPDVAPDARSWAVGDYLILYRVDPDAVVIVRILHGARDLGDLIGD